MNEEIVYVISSVQKPKNVTLVPNDPGSRYKMPQLQIQVIGKSKMIRTVLVNILDVAKSMQIPPQYPGTFFAYEIGAQAKFDEKKPERQQAFISGEQDAPTLSKLTKQFVEEVLLCPNCGLPECLLQIEQKKVFGTCRACGSHQPMPISNEKFKKFVINHPPVNSKDAFEGSKSSKKKDKKNGKKKDGDSEGSEGEASPEEEIIKEEPKKTKKEKKSKKEEEDDDDVVWFSNTSAAAAEERKKQMLPELYLQAELQQNEKNSNSNSNSKPKEEKKSASKEEKKSESKEEKKSPSPPAAPSPTPPKSFDMKDLQAALSDFAAVDKIRKEQSWSPSTTLQQTWEAISAPFTTIPPLVEAIKPRAELLTKIVSSENLQVELLGLLEKWGERVKKEDIVQVPFVLKTLYDADVLEEDAIVKWYMGTNYSAVKQYSEPFVKWLAEEDEEDEEEEEEGEEEEEDD